MRLRRSMLIVPAVNPAFLEKAAAVEADVLVIDVQDAIANKDRAKLEGRAAAAACLRRGGFKSRELSVRINSPDSPWMDDDLAEVIAAGADSVVVSRAYTVDDILRVEAGILRHAGRRRVEIILEVDTAAMLAELEALARHSRFITSLSVASGDFALEMQAQAFGPDSIRSDEWLQYCRGRIVAIARWKGWNAADYVRVTDPSDVEGIRAGLRRSRSLGFDGVTLLYPRFLPLVNETFGVSAAELAWAQGIVAEWLRQEEGPEWNKGARRVNGELITTPIYEYARRVLFFRRVLDGEPAAVARFQERGLAGETGP